MALGNHECRMKLQPETARIYTDYEEELVKGGIKIFHNEKKDLKIGNIPLTIYGLELPMEYYHKPDSPMLTCGQIKNLLGTGDPSRLNILLAHNPKYGKAYFSWNADLNSLRSLSWGDFTAVQASWPDQSSVSAVSAILLRGF